jgi:hypothetical protein
MSHCVLLVAKVNFLVPFAKIATVYFEACPVPYDMETMVRSSCMKFPVRRPRYHHTAPASRGKKKAPAAPTGPKPPDKQREVVEEKSIYDTDPDHPYENVERPPSEEEDEGEAMYRTGKAFAEDGPLYEPLKGKGKKGEGVGMRWAAYKLFEQ